ncbi:hypothetical protein K504DRAFT_497422 [Pleomassaria siparia CBS 279.74]|uniref:DUF300-domain-containing protein n=1 Tax=Pleomassaria siparia CBS 279.74 TaxID=1314801 RepID=A0A6G1KT99_9PLEO|nr:hypothetical protein K504DRAFT_497422 [Pleomassaria siparia CBS 279.74]
MSPYSSLNTLYSRSLFARDDSPPSNFTCARPKANEHGELLSLGITFKSLMVYITAACLILTAMSTIILSSKHLLQYTVPKQQKQIVRIIFMPFFFSVLSLFSVLYEEKSIYLKPITQVYEAFCVAAIFFLFLEYVCPEEAKRPAYFTQVENQDKKGNVIPGGSLLWYNRTWVAILQFPLIKTILTVVEISTQAANVYCANSLSPKYAHLWVILIDTFIISGALTALFRFYGRLKPEFDPKHHALAKLATFKGMLIFLFFLDIIFGFLNGKTFKPSAKFTYNDLYYGLPMMLTAVMALIFSLSFHWSFGTRVYRDERSGPGRLPFMRAALDAANLMDLLRGIYIAFVKRSPDGVRSPGTYQGWVPGGLRRQRTLELNGPMFGPARVPEAYRGFLERAGRSRGSSRWEEDTRKEPRNMV